MRLLLLLILISFTQSLFAQDYIDTIVSGTDTIILLDPNNLPAKLPTIHHLTPSESAAFTEQNGLHLVRMVSPANTYRWNDGTETITFAPGIDRVTICRYEDKEGKLVGYMIGGFDEAGNFPRDTKMGLFRKVTD